MKNKLLRYGIGVLALAILAVGCSHTDSKEAGTTTIRVITYDSFEISDSIFANFEAEHNIKIKLLKAESAGAMLATLVLTKDNPVADVVFGLNDALIQRALDEEIFAAYVSPTLRNVDSVFQINDFVTPVIYGDVCLNYWLDSFAKAGEINSDKPAAPTSIDDLISSNYRMEFVTQHPETSSPGLAFLLATIAKYGEDGWQDYWRQLKENQIAVRNSWSNSYYGDFIAGGGQRSIVTSYVSSPVAEVLFGEGLTSPPTGVILDSCFRQVEYAGILAESSNEATAQKVVDLFLSTDFQEDVPLNMFVYPVNSQAVLPDLFIQHAPQVENPLTLSASLVAEKRDEWTEEWVRILFR